jgi:hypothetical protein
MHAAGRWDLPLRNTKSKLCPTQVRAVRLHSRSKSDSNQALARQKLAYLDLHDVLLENLPNYPMNRIAVVALHQ